MLTRFNFRKVLVCSLCATWFLTVFVNETNCALKHHRLTNKREKIERGVKVSPQLMSKLETNKFMLYAFEKLGSVKCVTIVSDTALSQLLESFSGCFLKITACYAYKYTISWEGGNITSEMLSTFKAGFESRCGAYIILLRIQETLNFLHQADDMKLVNSRAKFLIWYEENDKKFEADEIWKKISNVILFHSKTKKIEVGVGNKVLFTVRGIRWPIIQNLTESRTRVVEFWNYNGPDDEPSTQPWYYDKTTDWKKSTINILVVNHPPGVLRSVTDDGGVNYSGTEIEVVKSLSKIMNFNYKFVDADPCTKWGGSEDDNGTLTYYGSVASMIYGEADMAIGSFFILKHYLDHMDMSIPLDVACTSFITPNPKPRPRLLALFFPFQAELWMLVLFVCCIIGPVILFGLTRIGHTQYTEHVVFSHKAHTVLTSFRIMTQVALNLWPRTWSTRLYIGWYWIFWMCITIAYRSTMISFLTIPLFEKPIDDLNDLVQSGLRIGGWGDELHRIFEGRQMSSELSDDQNILLDKYEKITNLDDGISLVVEGKFALFENLRFLKFIRMTRNLTRVGSPSMRIMKQCVVPIHIGFAYQKNSALTWTVNRFIRRFQESGLINKWNHRLIATAKEYARRIFKENRDQGNDDEGGETDGEDEGTSTTTKSQSPKILKILDLQGSFYLLLLGLGLSVIAFAAEIGIYKWHASQKDKKELKKMIAKTKLIINNGKLTKDGRTRKRRKRKLWKQPPFPYIE